ncbi:MAG TPA: 4Fe-4S dicluster domain-containing protein, partial [Nocardioidaceae bacterium]|nr:4Fe-4S dicluster domain-containing protein [Nocardioidaceae bacterium]
MPVVLILGLLLTAVALAIAGRRVWFLYRLITGGQPAPDRLENVGHHVGQAAKSQVVEVLGQKKLLKWTVPGAAHFFVFWAFLILATVYLEAYGALFSSDFHIPVIGTWPVLGFAQDFIAMMAFFGIVVFAAIRFKNSPERLGRKSRFEGSHLGGAWLTLFMIFNVIWTMFLFRGAAAATGHLPYENGAFISNAVGQLLEPLGQETLEVLEGVGLLLHIGVMLAFLILVVHSKHLHIFVAPLNVMFGRKPVALGAVKPLTIDGKPFDLEMVEEMDEDTAMGVGKVEDFTWKGMLDFATCTECGRCQDQCPAWNTEKPLSPKMVILNLRDHAFRKAPYILADSDDERAKLPADVLTEAERPLVGDTEGLAWHPEGGAIIDNDVLWSCVTCGACVEQCPVDIEHVDHIVDMRRYQVLVESNFPAELNGLFKGLENKGNPWNMSPNARMEWAQGLPFDVKVVGEDVESLDEVDWLFWVGCAGAYEDRAKKTTR